jgi:tetratricopeptide (TPR) repeat protein
LDTVGTIWNRARQLVAAGQFTQAESTYRQLLETVPEAADLWHELGLLQLKTQQPEKACECLRQATALDPASATYHANLGTAWRAIKRHDEAIASFQRALQLAPPSAELYNNFALALKDSGQIEPALAAFDQAIAIRQDYANGHFNRGNLLLESWRLDEAAASYQLAIRSKPDDADAYCKLGIAYYDLGRLDDALAAFEEALRRQPNYPEARRNRGLVLLSQGRFSQGWPDYEWRFECAGFVKRSCPQPRWDGSALDGRTLLVYAEQGLGDTLFFIRYLRAIDAAGGRIWAEVQSALVPLLEQSGFGQWLVRPDAPPDFDVHCPLASLPSLVAVGQGEPYWPGTYFEAQADRVALWKNRLTVISGFKVGIMWAGSPDYSHDRLRSVRLAEFRPLADIPGVRLISLQKGLPREQIAAAEPIEIVDLGDSLDESAGAFIDTAAVIENLDLVITVDTSVGHLAGGMGVPVWVALQISPDWRWQARGSITAWYPSMRLFRQTQFDVWQPVFAEIAGELRRLLAGSA